MILITTDPAMVDAVHTADLTPQRFERLGQAAAAGALDMDELVLIDRAALTTAAAVGRLNVPATLALLLLDTPTGEDWQLATMADVTHVVVLPAAAGWLRAHTN